MNPRTSNLLLMAGVVLITAGCVQSGSNERNASFAAYANAKIGQEAAKDWLTSRTAILIAGDDLTLTPSGGEPGVFHLGGLHSRFSGGVATAVDPRGYLLTAAHCLGKEPPYVLLGHGCELKAERASVVWRGNASKGEPDLAVLCLARELKAVFEWAPEVTLQDPVLAVGVKRNPSLNLTNEFFAGAILRCMPGSGARAGWATLLYNGPMHQGDSGGPLMDLDGRLLGINVAGTAWPVLLPHKGKWVGYAVRPDLGWLRRLIDEHAATHSSTNNPEPNQHAGGDGGTALLWRAGRPRPAAPQHRCSAG
jgi:S1-C subfamily serine protease